MDNVDLLLRKLDCAVINHIHASSKQAGLPAFDSVRGVFIEGDRLYENSVCYRETHIQICVCDPRCIKGVYRLPPQQLSELGIKVFNGAQVFATSGPHTWRTRSAEKRD